VIKREKQMKEQLKLVAKLQEVDRLLNRLGEVLEDLREQGLSPEEIHGISQELEQIAVGKEEMKSKIRQDLLQHYQRFYRRHHEHAVAKLSGGVCTNCFVSVPSAKSMRVRRAEGIEYCENCGAILIWDEPQNKDDNGDKKKK